MLQGSKGRSKTQYLARLTESYKGGEITCGFRHQYSPGNKQNAL